MQPIITIPGTIAFPSGSGFSQVIVFVTVQLFSFVTAEEGLYVRLVFRTLYSRIFQPNMQTLGRRVQAIGDEPAVRFDEALAPTPKKEHVENLG